MTPQTLVWLTLLGCGDQTFQAINAPPVAEITSPFQGDEVTEGATVTLRGSASDPDDRMSELNTRWYAGDVQICDSAHPAEDGTSECTTVITTEFTRVSLEVRDAQFAVDTDFVDLTVVPSAPPVVEIIEPTADGVYYSEFAITFQAQVSDAEDDPEELLIAWESDLDGTLSLDPPDSTGHILDFDYLSIGQHIITLSASDTTGKSSTKAVVINVLERVNTPPSITVLSPTSGASYEPGAPIVFSAEVADDDDAASDLAVTWSSDLDGEFGTPTPDSTGLASFSSTDLTKNTHAITATVTDTEGLYAQTLLTLNIEANTSRTGVYDITPAPAYSCATNPLYPYLGDEYLVNIDFSELTVVDTTPSISFSTFTAQPGTMNGSISSSGFSVSNPLSGGCTETYSLTGAFTASTEFEATFEATFTGDCDDCTDQSWDVTGVLK